MAVKFYPTVNLPEKMETKLRKTVSSSKIVLAILWANYSGISENIRDFRLFLWIPESFKAVLKCVKSVKQGINTLVGTL